MDRGFVSRLDAEVELQNPLASSGALGAVVVLGCPVAFGNVGVAG